MPCSVAHADPGLTAAKPVLSGEHKRAGSAAAPRAPVAVAAPAPCVLLVVAVLLVRVVVVVLLLLLATHARPGSGMMAAALT